MGSRMFHSLPFLFVFYQCTTAINMSILRIDFMDRWL